MITPRFRRKLFVEILERREMFASDIDTVGQFVDVNPVPDSLGLHGGERPAIEDQHGDEGLAPTPPSSGGGQVRPTDGGTKNGGGFVPYAGANISLTSGTVADGFGNVQSHLLVGQMIALRTDWTTIDLPGLSYTVGFYFDGVRVDSATLTGQAGNNSWYWYRYGSFASPGTHSFTIVVDPDNLISEVNESDNSISFSMSTTVPTNLPAKFNEPIGRTANQYWATNNYADVDPRSGVTKDYRNGPYQYDGHDARDAGPWGFSSQDEGIPIYAAADGVVDAVQDGLFDRETSFGNRPANYVQINHGNGFKTLYYHFATNTIVVSNGQFVRAGQLIAHMGSSGVSTGTHLHYTPYYRGLPIEMGYAPTVYQVAPLPYGGDVSKFQLETGISSNIQNMDLSEHISLNDRFPVGGTGTISFYQQVYNVGSTDTMRWSYYRPNGTLLGINTFVPSANYRFSIWWWNHSLATFSNVPGTWTVVMDINGTVQSTKRFTFDATGEAAMRVTLDSATLINSGRTTPIDFGTANSTVQKAFAIQNHGTTPLSLSNLRLPPGFSSPTVFPMNIPAGTGSTLLLNLLPVQPGASLRAVTMTTNDDNAPEFWFNVSGTVPGAHASNRSLITLTGPSTPLPITTSPTLIIPRATVTLPTNQPFPGFGGGQLKVEIANAPTSFDVLGINRVGAASGKILDSIGSAQGGTNGQPLIITFKAGLTPETLATAASIQQLIRNITYTNLDPKGLLARKYIRFTLTSSFGAVSNYAIAHMIPAGTAPLMSDSQTGGAPPTKNEPLPAPAANATTLAMQGAALESLMNEMDKLRTSRSKRLLN